MPITLPPISRRRFLAGSLAAGAAALLPSVAASAEKKVDPDRWALIADAHIGGKRDDARHDVKPAEMFIQIAAEILALDPLPGNLIFAGDTAFLHGQPENYALLRELLQPYRAAGITLHIAMGNHDERANFWAAFPDDKPKCAAHAERQAGVIEAGKANWFLLDSLEKTNGTPGLLGDAQLKWLAQELDARPAKPALLVAHHNLGSPLSSGLKDTGKLLEMVASRRHVKAYFYGHTHAWSVNRKEAIARVNIPATAWLFDAREPRGWLDMHLKDGGATLVLNSLNKQHSKHGEKVELSWKA